MKLQLTLLIMCVSVTSSVWASDLAIQVGASQIAIEQTATEGSTRLFADYAPHHSWGIYMDNPNDKMHLTKRDGEGFTQWSESGPSGTTTTTSVIQFNLYDGGASFYGNVGIGTTTPQAKLDVSGTIQSDNWQPHGAASSDFYVDVEPGTRTLRTRNWNTSSPNIAATGIHTGSGEFEGDVTIHGNIISDGDICIGACD